MIRPIIAVLCSVSAIALYAPLANAQSTDAAPISISALSVSPVIVESGVKSGETKEMTIRVTNITDAYLPVTADADAFSPNEVIEGGINATKMFDASQWFTIAPSDFILAPKETKAVSIKVLPPKGAEAGGHYAAIYFKPLAARESSESSKMFQGARVGVLAFLVVPGDITKKLEIRSLTTSKFQQNGPINFNVNIKNSGNVHILPTGHIKVTDLTGKEVAIVPLAPSIVLPNTTKLEHPSWDKKKLFGIYRAKLTLTYPGPTTLVSKQYTFIVIPWLRWLVLFLVMIFLSAFIWKTHRRWSKAWDALLGKSLGS